MESRKIVGFLVSFSKSEDGEFWPVYLGTNLIGSETFNDIILSEAGVSGRHARIVSRKAGDQGEIIFVCLDENSTQGTLVNNKNLIFSNSAAILSDNDIINIGGYSLVFIVIKNINLLVKNPDFRATDPEMKIYEDIFFFRKKNYISRRKKFDHAGNLSRSSNRSMSNDSKVGAVPHEYKLTEVVVLVGKNFIEYNKLFEVNLLSYIIVAVRPKYGIRVKKVEEGSIVITLEMEEKEAETLFILIKTGGLNKFGITDARLKKFESSTLKDDKDLGKDIDLCRVSLKKMLIEKGIEQLLMDLYHCIKDLSDAKNTLVVLLERLKRLNKEEVLSTIDFDMSNKLKNQITVSVLSMIDSLTSDDVDIDCVLKE